MGEATFASSLESAKDTGHSGHEEPDDPEDSCIFSSGGRPWRSQFKSSSI